MRTVAKTQIDWLLPQVRQKILAMLLTAPDQRWHLRDIARRTGNSVGTVKRELTGLATAEIVTLAQDGNRTYYQANRASPLFPELSGLMRKTAGLADVVRSALAGIAKHISLAAIYGSQASGTASAASDVDLLVVGDLNEMRLHEAVGEAEKQLNRAVNYTLLSTAEFRKRSKDRDSFLGRIMAGPKIAVIGGEHEVR